MTDGLPAVQDWWNPFTWFPTDPVSLLVIFGPIILVVGVVIVGASAAGSFGQSLFQRGGMFGPPEPQQSGPRIIVVRK